MQGLGPGCAPRCSVPVLQPSQTHLPSALSFNSNLIKHLGCELPAQPAFRLSTCRPAPTPVVHQIPLTNLMGRPPFICAICKRFDNRAFALCDSTMHLFCCACQVVWMTHALRIESSFPPRCCGKPLHFSALKNAAPDLYARALRKEEENVTTDKIYCADLRCSAFIPTAHLP